MSLSHAVAGGSRNVEAAHAFLRHDVNSATTGEFPPNPPASAYGWKRVLQERIWSANGPKGITARGILMLLLWHGDLHGRVWLSIPTLATKAGLGSLQTVRNALAALVKHGWLRAAPQTWSSLTMEQKAARRPVPRRGDVGQAPHLYTILDGRGRPVTALCQEVAPNGASLARVANSGVEQAEETPLQNLQGGPPQNLEEGPLPDPIPDLDPSETLSKEVSEEGATGAPSTHHFSQAQGGEWGWLLAWNLLVHAHAEKTRAVYGVPPLPPDMKRDQRQAVAECLDGTATELAAKLRARGMERELGQVRDELAGRVMTLYFKRDNEHLRRVKHALRDLPREFHARITEAMQLILRQSLDAQAPRRTAELELEQTAERPKVEKPVELAKSVVVEKPVEVVKPQSMPANTAREARRIIEALSAAPSAAEPSKANKAEPAPRSQSTKPALPEWLVAEVELEQARKHARRSKEAPQDLPNVSQPVQRSIGRPGAPRWGALGPSPAKVRRVSRPMPEGTGEGGEPPSTE
jgi:hypothetical protein